MFYIKLHLWLVLIYQTNKDSLTKLMLFNILNTVHRQYMLHSTVLHFVRDFLQVRFCLFFLNWYLFLKVYSQ